MKFLVRPFYEWITCYPLLCGVIAVVMAILGGIDGGMGLRLLFLDSVGSREFLAGVSAAIVLFQVCFVGYLLASREPWMLPPGATKTTIDRNRVAYLSVTVSVVSLLAIFMTGLDNPNGIGKVFALGVVCADVILAVLGAVLGVWIDRTYATWWLPVWQNWSLAAAKSNKLVAGILSLLNGLFDSYSEPQLQSVHARGSFFGFVFFGSYLLLVLLRPDWVSTAVTICILLSLIASIYGFIRFNFPRRFFGVYFAMLLFVTLSNGVDPYLHRFPGFTAEHYANPRSLKDAANPNPDLIEDLAALESWKKLTQGQLASDANAEADLTRKPKLIVVATSGGGIRAGVWTANILTALEKLNEDFPRHLRLVTGASGGMYGASYYVQTLNSPGSAKLHSVPPDEIISRIAKDSLREVANEFVLRDIPHFLTGNTAAVGSGDRGTALENAWKEHTRLDDDDNPDGFSSLFSQMAEGERQGWRPSLIVSPMTSDDGRRLLFSNLDLKSITESNGSSIETVGNPVTSVNAIEFFKLFPDVDIQLSTAVRMNASFPYISPDGVLPTIPERRVVDAGYYDNYGVNIAAAWLYRHRDWLALNTSGVLLIQIRDSDSELYRRNPENSKSAASGPISGGLSWLTTPLTAVLSARNSTNSFRNDEQLESLQQILLDSRTRAWENVHREDSAQSLTPAQLKKDVSRFFTTTALELDKNVSLSWTLTPHEISLIAQSAARDEITSRIIGIDQWLRNN